MSARALSLAGMVLVTGCGLVSGLSNLEITTDAAAPPQDASDERDVTTLPDGAGQDTGPIEAGPTDYALITADSYATSNASLSMSNMAFSLSL